MANKSQFQAIRGTRDLLPPETALWNRVEQTAHSVFATFGFGEIRPPIFESTELFARAVGGETDIVSKEMYTFEDHDLRDLENLRTSIVSQSQLGGPSEVKAFCGQVRQFLEELRRALDKGLIPGTVENIVAVTDLRMFFKELEKE